MGLIGNGLIFLACLAVAIWMIVRKKSKKIASWLMLIAGMFLGGAFGSIVTNLISQIKGTAGSAVSSLTGVGIGAVMTVLGILVFLELWHGIHPKKGKPSGFHPWLALVAPTLFVAAGGIFYKLIQGLSTTAGTVGNVTSLFGG
jgi:hypothetical protein